MRHVILALFLMLVAASRVSASTLATDAFTGSDANPIAGNWTTVPGAGTADLQRVNNRVRGVSEFNRNAAYYNAVAAPDDQWSQITIITANAGYGPCVIVRASAIDEDYYAACPQIGFVEIHKRVAGVKTDLVSDVNGWAPGDTNRIEAEGTTIRSFITGVEVLSTTDGTLASGQFGIHVLPSGPVEDTEGDDWSGGDFVTPTQLTTGTVMFQ